MKKEVELSLLKTLKEGLLFASKEQGRILTEKDFGSIRWKGSEKERFYLYDYKNNLFELPSSNTILGTSVEAVRSSAAMIFNLLGQKEFSYNGARFYAPEYETELKAIKDEKDSSHNAHLDATFNSTDKNEFWAVEAKMMEWLNDPKNLSPSYLNPNMYLPQNTKADVFIDFFKPLVYCNQKDKDERLLHKTERYDAIQMAIHILAIYNHFCATKSSAKRVVLQNIVWKYDCDDYTTEETEANEFVSKANKTFKPLFEELNIDFSVEYVTFQEFKQKIDFSKDKDREKYLNRYEISQ